MATNLSVAPPPTGFLTTQTDVVVYGATIAGVFGAVLLVSAFFFVMQQAGWLNAAKSRKTPAKRPNQNHRSPNNLDANHTRQLEAVIAPAAATTSLYANGRAAPPPVFKSTALPKPRRITSGWSATPVTDVAAVGYVNDVFSGILDDDVTDDVDHQSIWTSIRPSESETGEVATRQTSTSFKDDHLNWSHAETGKHKSVLMESFKPNPLPTPKRMIPKPQRMISLEEEKVEINQKAAKKMSIKYENPKAAAVERRIQMLAREEQRRLAEEKKKKLYIRTDSPR